MSPTLRALLERDFRATFGSPLGYLFITVFIVVTGGLAFVPDAFFAQNKANLDLLTEWLPVVLVLFVPAITMSAWAADRRLGTDQLLLTLPAHDGEVVLAKYLACLASYTVALLFTTAHVATLRYLGSPDLGLMASTFLGYWALGAALVAAGVLASALTSNLTIAYIYGTIAGAVLVGLAPLAGLASGLLGAGPAVAAAGEATAAAGPAWLPGLLDALRELGAWARFESFGRGVVALEDVVYFAAVTATLVYANVLWLGRRHWTTGSLRGLHAGVRLTSAVLVAASLTLLALRAGSRADLTSDRLLTLTPQARQILDRIDPARPVTIEAWISPEVPPGYRPTRDGLLRMLRELDARAGDRLEVIVHATEPHTPEAERAETQFGIQPERVEAVEDGRNTSALVFLGLVFRSGPREVSIPFFHRGLPIQYELTRGIGAAAELERNTIGVLTAGVNVFGGFDFQTMQRSPEWQVIADLKKQFDVKQLDGTAAIDTSVEVLVVPMPSALPQEQLDRVAEYLWQGGKALFFCDAFPYFDLKKAPTLPPGAGRNPFQQQQAPEPPRGDSKPLLAALGVDWPMERCVFDKHNPHPEFEFPPEVVCVVPGSATRPSGFNEDDPVSAGLQEVLLLWPGEVVPAPTRELTVTPLLQTGPVSGWHPWSEMMEFGFFGPQPLPQEARAYEPKGAPRTLAVRVKGRMRAPADGAVMKRGELSAKELDAIVVADMDLISDLFFDLRRRGDKSLPELDNVSFVANCIDSLAGEDAYLALRKLRPRHRTQTLLEAFEAEQARKQSEAAAAAKAATKARLDEARKRLDDKVKEVEARTDLDRRTKAIMLRTIQDQEQRRLDQAQRRVEDEERAAVRRAKTEANRLLKAERARIRVMALLLPPIPALLIGLAVGLRKVMLEREGTPAARQRRAS